MSEIDLSLVRVRQLFSLLPTYTRPTIHIAGTNGKGSVTALLSSVLTSSQISVGRFNSPHLLDVWDSISLAGRPVSQDLYRSIRAEVERINNEHFLQATNFEVLTATAAQVFERERVEVAIFEVGLGGKLDATNVLPDDSILASAITNVDLDHQQFLGNTPASIARVKAGIARPGKMVILGPQKHPEVEFAVQDVVNTIGGQVVKSINVTSSTSVESLSSALHHSQTITAPFPPWSSILYLELPLLGVHQLENLATTLTVLSVLIEHFSGSSLGSVLNRITPCTLSAGVSETRWPGRLERVRLHDPPVTLLVDGAHNAPSAAALHSYLISLDRGIRLPRTFVLGLSHSPPKSPFDTLSPLLLPGDNVALVHFTDVQDMPWVKNESFEGMLDVVHSLVKEGAVQVFEREAADSPLEPLHRALRWTNDTARGGRTVVLAGSLYLVSDLYRIAREQGVLYWSV